MKLIATKSIPSASFIIIGSSISVVLTWLFFHCLALFSRVLGTELTDSCFLTSSTLIYLPVFLTLPSKFVLTSPRCFPMMRFFVFSNSASASVLVSKSAIWSFVETESIDILPCYKWSPKCRYFLLMFFVQGWIFGNMICLMYINYLKTPCTFFCFDTHHSCSLLLNLFDHTN